MNKVLFSIVITFACVYCSFGQNALPPFMLTFADTTATDDSKNGRFLVSDTLGAAAWNYDIKLTTDGVLLVNGDTVAVKGDIVQPYWVEHPSGIQFQGNQNGNDLFFSGNINSELGTNIVDISSSMNNFTTGTDVFVQGSGNLTAATTVNNTLVLGANNFASLATSNSNVGIGTGNFRFQTGGQSNFAQGINNGANYPAGGYNVFFGARNGENGSGSNNLGIGALNLRNADGSNNVGIGSNNLREVSGNNNFAQGGNNFRDMTSGSNNVGIGGANFINLTTGSYNQAFGGNIGSTVQTASYNTLFGRDIFRFGNTLFNTFVQGSFVMTDVIDADNVFVFGDRVGEDLTTAEEVFVLGENSLSVDGVTGSDETAFRTIAIGRESLEGALSKDNMIALGYRAGWRSKHLKSILIGEQAQTSQDNQIALGYGSNSTYETARLRNYLFDIDQNLTSIESGVLLFRDSIISIQEGVNNLGWWTTTSGGIEFLGNENTETNLFFSGNINSQLGDRIYDFGENLLDYTSGFAVLTVGNDNFGNLTTGSYLVGVGLQNGFASTSSNHAYLFGQQNARIASMISYSDIKGRQNLFSYLGGDYHHVLGNQNLLNFENGEYTNIIGDRNYNSLEDGSYIRGTGFQSFFNTPNGSYLDAFGFQSWADLDKDAEFVYGSGAEIGKNIKEASHSWAFGDRAGYLGDGVLNADSSAHHMIAFGSQTFFNALERDSSIAFGFRALENNAFRTVVGVGIESQADQNNQIALGGTKYESLKARNYRFNIDQPVTKSMHGQLMTYDSSINEITLQELGNEGKWRDTTENRIYAKRTFIDSSSIFLYDDVSPSINVWNTSNTSRSGRLRFWGSSEVGGIPDTSMYEFVQFGSGSTLGLQYFNYTPSGLSASTLAQFFGGSGDMKLNKGILDIRGAGSNYMAGNLGIGNGTNGTPYNLHVTGSAGFRYVMNTGSDGSFIFNNLFGTQSLEFDGSGDINMKSIDNLDDGTSLDLSSDEIVLNRIENALSQEKIGINANGIFIDDNNGAPDENQVFAAIGTDNNGEWRNQLQNINLHFSPSDTITAGTSKIGACAPQNVDKLVAISVNVVTDNSGTDGCKIEIIDKSNTVIHEFTFVSGSAGTSSLFEEDASSSDLYKIKVSNITGIVNEVYATLTFR